ncbi:MAG: nuclease-related domain-containing protein, partial [Isosphaeraceae bacterium]
MKIAQRIRQWSEVQKVQPNDELADVIGGRDGELLLKELIGSSNGLKHARLLAGRRIPSNRQGRRREIDLIACTPTLIQLIEVKNWSGRLVIQNNAWRQVRRNGEVVDHGDLIGENLLKRDAVIEYLADHGLNLDDKTIQDQIVPKVIFTNPGLELSPEVEARPDVITRRELVDYLKQPSQPSLARRLIAFCLGQGAGATNRRVNPGRIPAAQYHQIVALLSETETWDELHLHGTRILHGDLIGLRIGPRTYRKSELKPIVSRRPIRLRWTRGRFWGFLKAVTGLGSLGTIDLGKNRLALSTDDT